MSNEFQLDPTICVSLRLNSSPEGGKEGRRSLSIIAIVAYSRKRIMIQIFFSILISTEK